MNLLLSYFKDLNKSEAEECSRAVRKTERQGHCVRVTGKGLPNGRALTVDLSEQGICLETFEPLEEGTALDLNLEVGHFPIALKSEVKWCQQLSPTIYRIGLSLDSSAPRTRHALSLYLKRL